ncbi:MAG: sigma-70 family RNA polymerase sigma factor, partial [Spirochaetaceae bacterium]|nr:sigma-70 family RNA polymerase sigma factor [Spirochaetaceae bacterium]
MPSVDNDELLVQQTIAGDLNAFAQLVRTYHRRITGLGMGFFKNRTDTEDFVQDVFLKLWANLRSFRGESRFATWCTRIAYNTAINAVNRRREYESIADEHLLLSTDRNPEEAHLRKITGEAVNAVIRELPREYALCLDLYFFHDLPYKDISEVTKLPVNTVKSHIFRAKKLLRAK